MYTLGGYTFTHDVRTYGQRQFLHVTEAQLREFISGMRCPVLQISDKSNRALWSDRIVLQTVRERLACIGPGLLTTVDLTGCGHHMHSDHASRFCLIAGPWIAQHYAQGLSNLSATNAPNQRPNGSAILTGSLPTHSMKQQPAVSKL